MAVTELSGVQQYALGVATGVLVAIALFALLYCKLRQLQRELISLKCATSHPLLDDMPHQESTLGALPGDVEAGTSPTNRVKTAVSASTSPLAEVVNPMKQQIANIEQEMQALRREFLGVNSAEEERWPGRALISTRTTSDAGSDVGSTVSQCENGELKKLQATLGAAGVVVGKELSGIKRKLNELRGDMQKKIDELHSELQAARNEIS